MQTYPHRYPVHAAARPEGEVILSSAGLPDLPSAPPLEFDGPGNQWSPETLLVGAAADCFILSFRAVASASKISWRALSCDVEGTLDRVDGVARFTHMTVRAHLVIPPETDRTRAQRLLEKSEKICIILNSLRVSAELSTDIVVEEASG